MKTKWMTPLLFVLWINPSSTVRTSSLYGDNILDTKKTEICLDPTIKEDYKLVKKDKKEKRLGRTLTKDLFKIPKNIFKPHKGVNMKATEDFSIALANCPYSGTCLVTSAFSHSSCHSPRSQHRKGEAVDIDWRNDGEEFLNWLDSEEGKQWLDAHNLDFEIENVSKMKNHPHYSYNRKATGPHIHLHIKK